MYNHITVARVVRSPLFLDRSAAELKQDSFWVFSSVVVALELLFGVAIGDYTLRNPTGEVMWAWKLLALAKVFAFVILAEKIYKKGRETMAIAVISTVVGFMYALAFLK